MVARRCGRGGTGSKMGIGGGVGWQRGMSEWARGHISMVWLSGLDCAGEEEENGMGLAFIDEESWHSGLGVWHSHLWLECDRGST